MAQKSNFIVRGGLDVSSITKGLASTQKQLNSFSSGIGKAVKGIAVALGGLAIGSYIKDSVSDAMAVESSMNQIGRIMGESSTAFNSWAQTQAKAYGMARTEAYKYGATYGNLISTFSKGSDDTEKKTEDLLKASAVVASATGRTMEDTMERIRSGLLGNTESIEDLGINVNVAMLQSTAAFKQFANGRSWQQLTFQEQQQIRLMAILEQANTKYGDSLAGTTATKQMMFLTTLKNIKLNLGQGFLAIYNVILPALNAMGKTLEVATSGFTSFMQSIFGKSVTTSIQSTTSATDELASSIGNTEDATTSAAKANEKALAGFDEVTKLSSNSTDGTSTTGAAITTPKVDTSSTDDGSDSVGRFTGVMEKLKTQLKPISDALDRLKTAFEPFKQNVGDGLFWFYNNVLLPFGSFTIGTIIPGFLDILSGCFNVLNPLIDALEPLGTWLWDSFLQPLASWTGGIIVAVLADISNGLNVIGDWITNHQTAVQNIAIVIGSFAAAWMLVNAAIGIWNVVAGIGTAVTTALGAAITFLTSPIGIVVVAIGALIAVVVLLARHWDSVKEAASACWDGIKSGAGAMGGFFMDFVVNPIIAAFKFLNNCVATIIEGLINGFIFIINGFISGINGMIGVINKIPGVELPSMGKMGYLNIPRMETGGIVDSATVAMIGENGKEAVMPLENNTGWITDLANKVSERMGNTGNGISESSLYNAMKRALKEVSSDTVLNVDAQELARAANKGNQLLNRRLKLQID